MQICLLGPLSVSGPECPSSIGPVQRRLLAFLAVRAGEVVTIDQIAEVLGSRSAGAVRTSVSRLRRVVGKVITAVPPGYLLEASCLDVRCFEELVRKASASEAVDRVSVLDRALGLWRGAALVEFADEDWARGEAARLNELRCNAAEDRIDALLAAGRHSDAVAAAEGLIAEHPLRERLWGLQMRGLACQGRTAEALRAYQSFHQHLAAHTGLEPSVDLQDLEQRILQGEAAPSASAGVVTWFPSRPTATPSLLGDVGVRAIMSPETGRPGGRHAAAAPPPGNLPRRRVELIGRHGELRRLAILVAPGGLVTLTGPGGVGKTRLALDACASAAGGFADGGWLVELASATVAEDVLPVVVRRLGLLLTSDPVDPESIARALGNQQRLVVLDNCEHVIEAVRELVDSVMGLCPNVAIVVTSREPLGCDGEQLVHVPTLSLASADGPSDAERLFRQRLTGVLGELDLGEADRVAIDEICTLLDGLPLALELAASRVGALGMEEVRARIAGRHDVLGRRRAVQRHRSLSTVVAWSYELLTPEEQRVFERLAVFADGFDLPAAEAVCGASPVTEPVADHLVSLIDKSLVTVQRTTPVRFRLLEVIRAYAEGRLSARGDEVRTADRFVQHYVGWIARADAGVRGPDELYWHRQLEIEWNNLRAVMNRAVVAGDIDAACGVVSGARWWAGERHHHDLGDWADAVLSMPGAERHPLIAIVGSASAVAAGGRADRRKQSRRLVEAEERERKFGEAPEPWVALTGVWSEQFVARSDGQTTAAVVQRRGGGSPFWNAIAAWSDALLPSTILGNLSATETPDEDHLRRVQRSVDLADALGNPTCTARAADLLGCALRRSDPGQAVAVLEGAIATARSVGNLAVEAENRFDLALVYADAGRPHDVITMQRDAIRLYVRAGAPHHAFVMAFACFRALVALGEHRAASLLLSRVKPGSMLQPWYENVIPARLEAKLRAEVGGDELAHLVAEGRALTVQALVAEVLRVLDELSP